MILKHLVALILLLSSLAIYCSATPRHEDFQFNVATHQTAVAIAKAALKQEIGDQEFARLKQFEARRDGENWIVFAHPYGKDEIGPHGGSFDVLISVRGGCVLKIIAEM